MTLAEFKAWFEGFTESMDGAPDEKQWKRIKARVKEIDGVAITKTVFVDRYVPQPFRPYYYSTLDVYCSGAHGGSYSTALTGKSSGEAFSGHIPARPEFDSYNAMLDLGKAEYKAVA